MRRLGEVVGQVVAALLLCAIVVAATGVLALALRFLLGAVGGA